MAEPQGHESTGKVYVSCQKYIKRKGKNLKAETHFYQNLPRCCSEFNSSTHFCRARILSPPTLF